MTFTMDDARKIAKELLDEYNDDPVEIIRNEGVILELKHDTLFKMYEESLISGFLSEPTTNDDVKFRRKLSEKIKEWRNQIE